MRFVLLFISALSVLCISKAADHFISISGGQIHYKTIGEGYPILIINGGPGFSSEGFQSMAQKVSQLGYQTILYDQRGTGQSILDKTNDSTVTMDLMSNDIESIRKHLGIDKWVVLGHSFGGIMANYYASQFPDHITAMIHSGSGGIDLGLRQTVQSDLMDRLTSLEKDSLSFWRGKMITDSSRNTKYKYYSFLASAYLFHKKYIPLVAERLMQGNMSLNRTIWADLERIPYDCKEALKDFQSPVLIIQGKQDIIRPSIAYKADSVFPNSEVVLLDQCGHYGWLDRPDLYFKSIDVFLKKYKLGG